VELVVAVAAVDGIGARAAEDRVVAAVAVEAVGAAHPAQRVVAARRRSWCRRRRRRSAGRAGAAVAGEGGTPTAARIASSRIEQDSWTDASSDPPHRALGRNRPPERQVVTRDAAPLTSTAAHGQRDADDGARRSTASPRAGR
jgi:hypothetical protein